MKNSDGRLTIGVILVGLGIFLLIDKVIHFQFFLLDYIFTFPSLMIIAGIIILINSRNNFFGYLLLIIGLYFLLKNYMHFPVNRYLEDFWPLAIIGFGIYLLIRKTSKTPSKIDAESFNETDEQKEYQQTSADFIDEVNVFGGTDRTFTSQQFKGGKITTIFGGTDIDLRESKLGGERQIIDQLTLFGGTTIFVPSDWRVVVSVVSIFGGFNDERRLPPGIEIDNEKILVIKGTVIFGGGELKS